MGKWSKAGQRCFISSKCSLLPVGSRKIDRYHYNLGGTNLKYANSEKDIGVIIHKALSFEEHISTKVNNIKQIESWNLSDLSYLDKDTFLKLYKAYIGPLRIFQCSLVPILVERYHVNFNRRDSNY